MAVPCPFLAINPDPYHFACDGPVFGIPHFWNLVTNLPFFFVGLWGLWRLTRSGRLGDTAFRNWAGLWISTALVCVGSWLYHAYLTPWGLALDRVAICGIIAFLGAHVAHVVLGWGPSWRLSFAFLAACEATVVAWYLGASPWWYGALQALGALALLVVVIRAHRRGTLGFPPAPIYQFAAWYAVAKLFEAADVPVCEWTGCIGGHPFKHLASAVGLWCLGRMMARELAEP